MRAKLSLLGLYNWDSSLLDGLILPDNFWSGALDQLKNNLLMETAELEILYPDPVFMKYAITQWCGKRISTWKWLRDTQLYDYNPIWNADYTDKHSIGRQTDETIEVDYVRDLTDSGDNSETVKESGGDDRLTSVYGYNENSAASPKESEKINYGKQTKSEQVNILEQSGRSDTDTDRIEQFKENYSRTLQGNYGVKTTQEMIKEEQELAEINLLDYIITDFKKRFCLLVY